MRVGQLPVGRNAERRSLYRTYLDISWRHEWRHIGSKQIYGVSVGNLGRGREQLAWSAREEPVGAAYPTPKNTSILRGAGKMRVGRLPESSNASRPHSYREYLDHNLGNGWNGRTGIERKQSLRGECG